MKIAILGTKGIPNNYGGFEQFAEYLSKGLVLKGHDVTVYNPHFHPYKQSEFEGVTIKTIYSPEKYMGGAANFLYDFLCLKDAVNNNFDLIYEAGYHSVAPSYVLLKRKSKPHPVIVTNMDGLEWKRSKWNYFTKKLIKRLERIALNNSHYVISDNVGIQQYYLNNFGKSSFFIPYGANLVKEFDSNCLKTYDLVTFGYYLIIARLEPENNIEMILEGYLQSKRSKPICIIGNTDSGYGKLLTKKYQLDKIRFLGPNYSKTVLDSLRHFSQIYFHGHSVGGTNPSLLEAMACQCFIYSHDNPFNRSVLENNGFFFHASHDVSRLLQEEESSRASKYEYFNRENISKIRNVYDWNLIIEEHESLFTKLTSSSAIAEPLISER